MTPAQLLRALRLSEPAYRAALSGLQQNSERSVLREQEVLPKSACATLREAVDAAVTTQPHGKDTVDGAPDFQVNLTVDQMTNLIGIENMARLGSLVHRFESLTAHKRSPASSSPGAASASTLAATQATRFFLAEAEQSEGVEVFVRRYSSAGRCV